MRSRSLSHPLSLSSSRSPFPPLHCAVLQNVQLQFVGSESEWHTAARTQRDFVALNIHNLYIYS